MRRDRGNSTAAKACAASCCSAETSALLFVPVCVSAMELREGCRRMCRSLGLSTALMCCMLRAACLCSAAELVAAQRLEAAERRKMEEKERRLKQVGSGAALRTAVWGFNLLTLAAVLSNAG